MLARAARYTRRIDPGLGVALAFATLSAWPLLTRASLPTLTDAHHHIYRAYEILAAWREGIWYTRWAPDLYYGYGYPVFNFYAPLTHYLAAAYGVFFGVVAGVKFALVLATFIGTLGVYLFGRDSWGPLAGAVSAAVYATAPYITLIDPVIRGALPEAFAIGLGPLAMWAFTRLMRTPSRGFFALAVLSLAALIASHNLVSFVLVGFTAGWVLWELLVVHRPAGRAAWIQALGLPLAAGLLALGLAAFIWLPAILERSTVQYWRSLGPPTVRRYTTAADMLAPTLTADAQAFDAGDFPFRIGVPQWIFGLLGALTLLRAGGQRRASAFFVIISLAAFGLIMPQADFIWRAVPALAYLQFSYRLYCVLVPCLAWLAGAALGWIGKGSRRARLGLAAAMAGLCALAAVPMLTPLPWPDFGPVNRQAILALDLYGLRGVGTSNDGEFLPTGVVAHPIENPAVVAAIQAGTVEKVDRAALPAEAQVTNLQHDSLHDTFAIVSPAGFGLRIFTFYWPGWTAYLDGARVPIRVTDPEGYISVAIPPGGHTLTLSLEDTPARTLAWIVSAGALAALAGALLVRGWPAPARLPAWRPAGLRPASWVLALAGMVPMAMLVRLGWDASVRWHAAHDVPLVPAAQVQRFTRFDDGLALAAYDFPAMQARPGDKVSLTFYWESTRWMAAPASVFVHFYGPDGAVHGQADKPDPVIFYPTTRWALGHIQTDIETAVIKADAPPGTYTVAVGLWDRATGQRSHPLDAAGQPLAVDKLILSDTFQVSP